MTTKTEEKKPFIAKKPASPFNVDPYNNRGGKAGKGIAVHAGGGGAKIKPMNVAKQFKGGSGGDR